MNKVRGFFLWDIKIYLVAQAVKNLPAMWETWIPSLGQEDSPGEGMATHSQYSCLENPHGQRSLVGYSPQGGKESDTTEGTQHSAHKSFIKQK